jgi:hypothetical protein
MQLKTKLLLNACGVVFALSASTALPDPPSALHPRPAVDPRTLTTLIKQGQDAFEAGDLIAARDAFADAFSADPTNLTAARDLAITYLRLEKPAKATRPLEVAAGAKSPDRGLVLAMAAQRVSIRQPMQAVKLITTYLDAHPSPPDQSMLDAMGIALSQAEAAGVKSSFFTDAQKVYKKLNAKLEATHPGEKRWGIDWMPSSDVDQKQSTVNSANAAVRSSTGALSKLDAQIAVIQRQKDAVVFTEGDNNQTQKKDAYQKQIDELNVQRSASQKELDDAQKTLADLKPHWPDAIAIDDLTLASGSSVASAAPGNTSGPNTSGAAPTATPAPAPSPSPSPTPAGPSVTPTPDATPDPKPNIPAYHGTHYAAAFAIAPDLLVTASSAVADATDIEIPLAGRRIGQTVKAEVVRADSASGLTVLRVADAHFTPIPIGTAAKSGAVKCEGFPEVNLFGPVPQELSGALSPTGEHPAASLDKLPRIPGGPLLQDGKVVAVEMGDRDSERDSIPAITVDAFQALLASDATGKAPVSDMKNSVFQITASR